jgi:hypothetical protein
VNLVHEVLVFSHQFPEAVSDVPQALLQGAQPLLQRPPRYSFSRAAATFVPVVLTGVCSCSIACTSSIPAPSRGEAAGHILVVLPSTVGPFPTRFPSVIF